MRITASLQYPKTPPPHQQLKFICLALCALLLALCTSADAQQHRKIPKVAVLEPGSATTTGGTCNNGFRQGLRDLGYGGETEYRL